MHRADVVIVGGGFMGAAAALFLRRHGRSVVLLERGLVGQQASGVNFGAVRRQGRYLPQLPLANRSRELWGRLRELVGDDCEFLPRGHLRVCYEADGIGELEQYAAQAREYGLDLELLSRQALRARYPMLGNDVVGGSFSPQDGHANPRLAAPCFGQAASRAGAVVLENAAASAIGKAGDDFVVEIRDGRQQVRAPVLLVTAGAWANEIMTQLGPSAPLAVHGPQMGVTEPLPYRLEPVVGVSTANVREVLYLRQVERGNIIFGGGPRGIADPKACRAHVEPANILNHLAQLRRILPQLRTRSVIRVWSGIESYLPDDRPIMGRSPTVSGLYFAFGFCGHGFQLGPGVGETMAELISTGRTDIDLAPYRIDRFCQPADAPFNDTETAEVA